jgi:hypothetical protein
MKRSNILWRGITVGGLSLALAGAVGLPASARAAGNENASKGCRMMENQHAMRSMHEKMLKQAKAEDAHLEKLIKELNSAPEAKKTDIEAKILNQLVAQHHKMLCEWETMHARMAAMRKEHMQASTGWSKNPTTAQK